MSSNNPFLNTRRIKRLKGTLPPQGSPPFLQLKGNLARQFHEAPQLASLGAQAPIIAGAGANRDDPYEGRPQIVDIQGRVLDPLRYTRYQQLPLSIGIDSVVVLPEPTRKRTYLFIQCSHPTQSLFINFGVNANTLCLQLVPAVGTTPGGFIGWDVNVPQDAIHIIANGAGTTGVLIYSESDF